jgi:hypothetical protein
MGPAHGRPQLTRTSISFVGPQVIRFRRPCDRRVYSHLFDAAERDEREVAERGRLGPPRRLLRGRSREEALVD